jgi:putative nucleotidyltransferase with HDIG domain
LWVFCLAGAAASLAAVLIGLDYTLGSPFVVLALCVAAAFAERGTVRLSRTTELSISPALTLFAAVLFGPLASGIVGAASELGDSELFKPAAPGRQPYLKWLNYTSSRFIAGAAMGICAEWVRGESPDTTGLVLATILASLVGEALEVAFASVTSVVRGNRSHVVRTVGPLMVTATCVYAPAVAGLAYAYSEVSPWTALLFLAPALAAQRLFSLNQEKARLYDEQLKLTRDLTEANETLRSANLSFATALVQTLEESDRYTAGHSRAVATYSRDIAEQLGMPPDDQELTYLCGLVHDIGKIGLSPALLNKEGRLTLEERREMERHSEIGERILEKVAAYQGVANAVRHHHERIDGEGYPDRLRGEDIPRISRIIAVADAYNAMTSDRPYRKAMPFEVARDRLLQAMGSQFEPDMVVAFLAVLATQSTNYREARGDGFGNVDGAAAIALVTASLDAPRVDAA